MTITGVILAAGTSARMGPENKLLLKYKNRTIIEETLAQMMRSDVDDIIIVTGFERAQIEGTLAGCLNDRAKFVHNSNYRRGRAESIKRAVKHIANRADAALFMVADKPGVSSTLINRAIERYRADNPAILYVETPTGRGHPIIFSKAVFDDLLRLKGDCVGDELVANHSNDLIRLTDETPQIDVDSDEDYRILLDTEGAD